MEKLSRRNFLKSLAAFGAAVGLSTLPEVPEIEAEDTPQVPSPAQAVEPSPASIPQAPTPEVYPNEITINADKSTMIVDGCIYTYGICNLGFERVGDHVDFEVGPRVRYQEVKLNIDLYCSSTRQMGVIWEGFESGQMYNVRVRGMEQGAAALLSPFYYIFKAAISDVGVNLMPDEPWGITPVTFQVIGEVESLSPHEYAMRLAHQMKGVS